MKASISPILLKIIYVYMLVCVHMCVCVCVLWVYNLNVLKNIIKLRKRENKTKYLKRIFIFIKRSNQQLCNFIIFFSFSINKNMIHLQAIYILFYWRLKLGSSKFNIKYKPYFVCKLKNKNYVHSNSVIIII